MYGVPAAVTLHVLADASRLAILELLRERERPVGELVGQLDQSQPGVSRHLRVLREAGLVEARPDGQRRIYRLRSEPLEELDTWLSAYRCLWTSRLDQLEAHLDERRST
jgi:DNA-binding transcriptional ArsR family regulator